MSEREYVVVVKPGVDLQEIETELTASTGAGPIPNRSVDVVNARPGSKRMTHFALTDEEAKDLEEDDRILSVEIPVDQRTDISIGLHLNQPGSNMVRSTTSSASNINWGLRRCIGTSNSMYQNNSTPTGDYLTALGGKGVDVVIQDSGIQADHPEWNDRNGVSRLQQIDWYTASGLAGTQSVNHYRDYDGHGTHCAGIAAGLTYGWAKAAHIYAQKVSGLEGSGDAGTGIAIADVFDTIRLWHSKKNDPNDAAYTGRPTVVNMSWGYGSNITTDPTSGNYQGNAWVWNPSEFQVGYDSRAGLWSATGVVDKVFSSGGTAYTRIPGRVASVDAEIDDMVAAGIHICIAAGNDLFKQEAVGGADYDNTVVFGGNTYFYHRGSSPHSDADSIFKVANIDYHTEELIGPTGTDIISDSSTRGPGVDILAPGTEIMSACSTTNRFTTEDYPANTNYRITQISGTSMAAPQVAGVIAQHLEVFPELTPAQMYTRILADAPLDTVYTTGSDTDYNQYTNSLMGTPNKMLYSRYGSEPLSIGNFGLTSSAASATYALTTSSSSVDEGDSFTITLTTTGLPAGTTISYAVSGVQAGDLSLGSTSGTFTLADNTYDYSAITSLGQTDDFDSLGEVDIFIRDNGTDVFILGYTGTLSHYTLGTAWDITSTKTLVRDLDLRGATGTGIDATADEFRSFHIDPSGTKVLVRCDDNVGAVNDDFQTTTYQFNLGTAWDISSTRTAVGSLPNGDVPITMRDYYGVRWAKNGQLICLGGNGAGLVSGQGDTFGILTLASGSYDISVGGTITTYTQSGLYGSDLDPFGMNFYWPWGCQFNNDGTKFYLTSGSGYDSIEFPLDTPYDPNSYSSGAVTYNPSVGGTNGIQSFHFADGGKYQISVLNASTGDVRLYSLFSTKANAAFTIAEDSFTEGTETFTLALVNGQASVNVTVNDTSTTPAGPTYSLASDVTNVNEGDTVTFTLTTTSVTDGTLVPYTISGVTSADMGGASLTGNFTVNSNTADLAITFAEDSTTEGAETIRVSLDNGQDFHEVTVNDTSTTPPPPTATYSLSGPTSINEGETLTVTLTTTNVSDGTNVPYTVTGVGPSDWTSGSSTGNFTVNSNTATAQWTFAEDLSTENTEIMTIALNNGEDTINVNVQDTSRTVTYNNLSNDSGGSINEGESVTFTLTGTNVPDGTTVGYTVTGINAQDTTDNLTGNIVMNSNTGSVIFSLSEDLTTEGAETLTFTLASTDSLGTATGGLSQNVTINDTSQTFVPDYTLTVTNSGNSYRFTGSDRSSTFSSDTQPALNFNAGDKVRFSLSQGNTATQHPFYIKTVQGTGVGNQASGVVNAGTAQVDWTIGSTGTYYYQCSIHDGMNNTITVS